MLSSVSYVCLGMCAGMWVISRVYIWACWCCLSSRSCCSSVRVIHYEQGGTCRAFSELHPMLCVFSCWVKLRLRGDSSSSSSSGSGS